MRAFTLQLCGWNHSKASVHDPLGRCDFALVDEIPKFLEVSFTQLARVLNDFIVRRGLRDS
jgi:hypothetical protein